MLAQPLRHLPPMGPFESNDALPRDGSYYNPPSIHPPPQFQRPYAKSVGSHFAGLTYAQHEQLRQRKTPQGRLCEEFDASSIDDSLALPASKHVLLTLPQHNQRQGNGSSSSYIPSSRRYDSRAPSFSSRVVNDRQNYNTLSDRIGFPPAWDFPGGIDSMLNQNTGPGANARAFYQSRSNIPTVLPGNFQSALGPTASAGQQYFGPYWPDGTFTPYRPASIRDDPYSGWRNSHDSMIDTQPQGLYLNQPERSLMDSSLLPASNIQAGHNIQPQYDSLPPLVHSRRTHRAYPSFHDRINALYPPSTSTWSRPEHEQLHPPLLPEATYNDTYLQPTPASDQVAYRDRTFTWAHRVYVQLLAQIQRDNKAQRQLGNSRPFSKPSIFPRPPQRIGSNFSEPSSSATTPRPRGDVSLPRPEVEAGTSRPTTAIRQPVRRSSDFGPTRSTWKMQGNFSLKQPYAPQFDILAMHSYNPIEAQYSPTSPFDVAQSALDTIELICNESNTPWTNGMLLAGCLAYGLADYNKALSWYESIVKLDPTHVEAISNLAATLLAVGRREEAQRNWLKAVNLRPSYFEAVEHLIGLLCHESRTRQAVETIEYVENCLRLPIGVQGAYDTFSDGESDNQSRTSSATMTSDHAYFDYETERRYSDNSHDSKYDSPNIGTSGYAIPAADNGRLLALVHAKGNMLYALNDNRGAAAAFEEAILIATGYQKLGIRALIEGILRACVSNIDPQAVRYTSENRDEPILLTPQRAEQTARRMFAPSGNLPGLDHVMAPFAHKAAVATASNSLLSLAKIYQDGLCSQNTSDNRRNTSTREILALYYLSLSLQQSPSTANNVGILLAGVQNATAIQVMPQRLQNTVVDYTGIVPGSGIALALQYYNYGLNLDGKHAHLYTNLGSLLKDLGQLPAAIKMYETAVSCDGTFDIALANLANAVKDQGRIGDAITFYQRAVRANPDFAEAVCGLATALNSVCNWVDRGGIYADGGNRDRVHVNAKGMMYVAQKDSTGWMNRVVDIVEKQLREGESWGTGTLTEALIGQLSTQLVAVKSFDSSDAQIRCRRLIQDGLQKWSGRKWEGSRVVRIIERAIKFIGWQWYQDRYKLKKEFPDRKYARPTFPANLTVPAAPTVLPFHTFTTPLSAKQVRQISQRNALRISVSTLKSAWLPRTVYPPPAPPAPHLNVGYVSSDFNNHPLAHLMQSIFGLHNPGKVRAFCYATTASDNSVHRQQIEREAPIFHDASAWSVEKLVDQIVADGIHILVNLNGYTRGARNEVFAARPTPIHMSFMGFAGTLGAEWCDYVYADELSVPTSTLSPWRRQVDIEDKLHPDAQAEDIEGWIYAENVIYSRASFFCVDHKQSSPDSGNGPPPLHNEVLREQAWKNEQDRRWKLRKELFPTVADDAIILGNFNQLYKIDPATFRMYLRILSSVKNSILWLLRFPDVGEQNLLGFAKEWAGAEVAQRIIFTDVAPKGMHITRASVVDLFLDTPECNAHTTAADVIWSGTPIVTWARWDYKMCSRMASSIVASALPQGDVGDKARADLLVNSENEYEEHAIELALKLRYPGVMAEAEELRGRGTGRLMDLRRLLWEGRWTSRLFDTKRWVRDLEEAYTKAWKKWEDGEGGDIWL